MSGQTLPPRTPITTKADRSDGQVRLLEEAVLMLRGDWPSAATGLCMRVNSAHGFTLGGKQDRRRTIDECADEALRLVEKLYGPSAVAEVRREAAADRGSAAGPTPSERPAVKRRPGASLPGLKPLHRGPHPT
jgi:hypothetical protein